MVHILSISHATLQIVKCAFLFHFTKLSPFHRLWWLGFPEKKNASFNPAQTVTQRSDRPDRAVQDALSDTTRFDSITIVPTGAKGILFPHKFGHTKQVAYAFSQFTLNKLVYWFCICFFLLYSFEGQMFVYTQCYHSPIVVLSSIPWLGQDEATCACPQDRFKRRRRRRTMGPRAPRGDLDKKKDKRCFFENHSLIGRICYFIFLSQFFLQYSTGNEQVIRTRPFLRVEVLMQEETPNGKGSKSRWRKKGAKMFVEILDHVVI